MSVSKSLYRAGFRCSALALSIAFSAQASAAGATPEVVNVIGQGAQLEQALQDQRMSDSVESVVHADAIGQLPDDNAAEALQRVPGVSVERDQGEGRFVRVRGLGADLNSVTINGTLVPAPEDDRRAVALDVLPSELVQSLSVVKTLTPDMDANSLGGTVEVESLSGFDHPGTFYSLSSEASYNDNTGKTSPKVSGAISNRFSVGQGIDNFAVAAALSWEDRTFGSDNVETGGAWDFDDASGARLEELEERRYDISRKRLGAGLNFDFRPDEDTDLYLRTLYSRYKDTETRQANVIEFADAQLPGERGDAEGTREVKDRSETQEIKSFVLGGERRIGDWTLSSQYGYSEASEDSPLHIPGSKFVGNSDFSDAGYDSSREPNVKISDAFYQAGNFTLDEIEREKQLTTDTEQNIRIDLTRDYYWQDLASQVKFGTKFSTRTKDNDLEVWAYEDLTNAGFTIDQLNLANFVNGNGKLGPEVDAGALEQLIAGLNPADFYDAEQSRINDFSIEENINAAYIMNTVDIDDLRIIAGLRYEGTRLKAKGTGINDGAFEAVNERNDYHHWLPGLHAIYQLNDSSQLRAAWTNTVVRPTFGQLFPGFVIDGDEAEFGNPQLDVLESSNFDLGIEHYMGKAGAVSAFVFYKNIENFVYSADLAGTGEYAAFAEAKTYANGDKADVYGLELAYSQQFEWLPAPWNGLLLSANGTFTRSDADIEQFNPDTGNMTSRSISLPGQSDTSGNLILGWENDRMSLRVATNYQSDYLDEVGNVLDKRYDTHVDDQFFVDISAHYFLTKQLQIFVEAQNITDESYYAYTGDRSFNAQYEEYGPTYKVGLSLTHF
ncbi:TonB-dependent receptor [Pseudomonas sp. 5Ae-yellow]|uniref:TonB-dependent receptor n=1 Tax=Pseudomonas sp. 5Ae-yellow TaxID=2759848 RepID=UPI0015F5075E|nr:TonB-dependent receptor [Pseudomonas sp. 5Ae-yellow]MBA6419923.1 TonB-dependent receptor [Pseudomonas sp. 5Ae-yellow]|tara:strand:+ start:1097 stop:3610 length:2514 start_codon:yes stop_codon:yes gene_type:complete